jgi:hypothetical protein
VLWDARDEVAALGNKGFLHLARHRGRLGERTWRRMHELVGVVARMCNRYMLILEGHSLLSPDELVIEPLPEDLDEAFGPST